MDLQQLRFLRIIQDLDKTNLTDRLCFSNTTDEMRSRFHRPKLVIFGICIGVLISLIAVFRFMPQLAAIDPVQQSTAIEKLRSAIANDYSYRDLHGVDWDQRLV